MSTRERVYSSRLGVTTFVKRRASEQEGEGTEIREYGNTGIRDKGIGEQVSQGVRE